MTGSILNEKLEDNFNNIYANIPKNKNFIKREVILSENKKCYVLYISGIADKVQIQDYVLKPLLSNCIDLTPNNLYKSADEIIKNYIYASEIHTDNSVQNIAFEILNGKCAIIIDDLDKAIICDVKSKDYRSIQESTTEKSIFGSKESFVENLDLNLTMIQRKIKNPDLKVEKYIIGEKANNEVMLIYIDKIIDEEVLKNIKAKLAKISISSVAASGVLEQLLEDKVYNIFPMANVTEKTDKVAVHLLEGKAAFLISESSSALIAPTTFIEFFQAYEDYTDKTILATFSRLVRLAAILTVVILEPIYLILLNYNAELFPYKLISIIIQSRQSIPLPPILEILAMDLAIEILREGGLRLPSPIGTTLAIVGGIVIGQSATKAGIVSDVTLFIVAITVISTFIVPNYQMALTIRFIRFPMLILGQFLGFFGLLIGAYVILISLTKLSSFGVPYLSPLAPVRFRDNLDAIFRAPVRMIFNRPKSLKISKKK